MKQPTSIADALSDAARALSDVSESPRLDAETLLAWTLQAPRAYLFTHPEEQLQEKPATDFSAAISRREMGEPVAYITGTKEFWSMEFKVSSDTLVPRPETELLVEQALALITQDSSCRVLDLGTGSGAIAIVIASERPKSMVDAVDSSSAALMIAKQNAALHGIRNVEFLQGSWTAPVADRTYDVIISNPPYVADGDPALEDLKHEPITALTAGSDGLAAIRKIAGEARAVIEASGSILFEHGIEQQDSVAAVLQEHGWTDIACFKDLAGQPRVTTAKMGTPPPKDQP